MATINTTTIDAGIDEVPMIRPRKLRTTRPKPEIVVSALLTSNRVEDVAVMLNTSKRTIYRYLADKEFQALFDAAKARLLDEAIIKLRTESSRAVDVLVEIAQDKYCSPPARVAAARSIVQFAIEAGQIEDLEKKLHDLEAKTIDAVVAESGKQPESDNHQWNDHQEWKANGKVWQG
jgi:AcrR family transcriptional regulator